MHALLASFDIVGTHCRTVIISKNALHGIYALDRVRRLHTNSCTRFPQYPQGRNDYLRTCVVVISPLAISHKRPCTGMHLFSSLECLEHTVISLRRLSAYRCRLCRVVCLDLSIHGPGCSTHHCSITGGKKGDASFVPFIPANGRKVKWYTCGCVLCRFAFTTAQMRTISRDCMMVLLCML